MFEEGGGEGIQVGQERFTFVNSGAGEKPAAVIQHVEHGEELFGGRKPAVRRGIELPEFADLGTLPAADGSRRRRVGLGMSELIFDGPATDLGAVEDEITQAQDFTGGEAVIGRWSRGETFAQQCDDFGWPVGGVIAAGGAGCPVGFLMMSAGAEVICVELVEATAGESEFARGATSIELLSAEGG